MSRSAERVANAINLISKNYKETAYYLDNDEGCKLDTKDTLLLSVVIPARNEFPNIVHTVHSIINCFESDGYDPKELEIIIVNNCSDEASLDEKYWTHPVDFGTTSCLEARGIYYTGTVRTIYDPIAGNHSARNKGAEVARGKYLFFSDAHMSYRPGFFKKMIEGCAESGGLMHGTIAWMGTYPPHPGALGYQYTLKLGEEIKGTWANYLVHPDKWFYIAAQGHCSVMVNRKQFLDFGGYPKYHRSYGGGEFYLDMKWWMYGSSVAVHPQAIGYHLKSFRGYSWTHDDYVHNVYNIGYALGMDEWLERTYLNYIRKGRKELHDRWMTEAKKEMQSDREEIAQRKKKSFNDVLFERPWDVQNLERHGTKNSSVLIFHYTWLELLKDAPDYVKEIYNNSPLQKQLEEFITTKLHDNIYKWQEYEPKYKK